MNAVLTVTAGAVEGFGTVYAGLEQSAGILGTNLSGNSVQIIEHKYGPSAGNVAAETFDTVGNIINVNRNMKLLTPKGFATRSVKNAGKALVSDFRPTNSQQSSSTGNVDVGRCKLIISFLIRFKLYSTCRT